MGLHSAGRVHRVAPQVVNKLADANHTAHHGPRMDPDPDRKGVLGGVGGGLVGHDRPLHGQRHFRHRRHTVRVRIRNPPHHHVGIPDRLDFFEAIGIGQRVKGGKNVIELLHQLARGDVGC